MFVKPFVTMNEFRDDFASVTENWLETRVAQHPEHCFAQGEGKNCRITIETEFFLGLCRAECAAHGKKAAKEATPASELEGTGQGVK